MKDLLRAIPVVFSLPAFISFKARHVLRRENGITEKKWSHWTKENTVNRAESSEHRAQVAGDDAVQKAHRMKQMPESATLRNSPPAHGGFLGSALAT